MSGTEMAQRGWSLARGLRWLVRNPVTLEEADRVVADEVARRAERFADVLATRVWPFPESPARRLLVHAGLEAGDVRSLLDTHGLDGTLAALRDAGVYVSYEEYHGRVEAVRGSGRFTFSPADFFNPLTKADYLAATGGSRSSGTPVELSFAWQRRQGMKTPLQHQMTGALGAPSAVWLPVFPSAAGFGAVMKNAAGGQVPERWFSQIPTRPGGISTTKQVANRFLPLLNTLARTGLPSPEHVPTDDPAPVVAWLRDALAREGRALLAGYASSITAAARYALDHDIDLSGVVATPASEPVTAGKLAVMRAAGMVARPMYAFVPEGVMGVTCAACAEEEYHVWDNELAVVARPRLRADGTEVSAFLWTTLVDEAPRVMLNVENDDYGEVRADVACDCALGRLGLTTRVRGIRGLSKVVAAGISLDGEEFDRLVELELPARVGGGPGDFQFVEDDGPAGTRVSLRIHPRVADVHEQAATEVVRTMLTRSDNGVLAREVWMPGGTLRVVREAPAVTPAGKTLAYERLASPPTTPAGATPARDQDNRSTS